MKAEIERRARDLGISEQGFIRLSIKMMMNKGKLTPEMITNGELS